MRNVGYTQGEVILVQFSPIQNRVARLQRNALASTIAWLDYRSYIVSQRLRVDQRGLNAQWSQCRLTPHYSSVLVERDDGMKYLALFISAFDQAKRHFDTITVSIKMHLVRKRTRNSWHSALWPWLNGFQGEFKVTRSPNQMNTEINPVLAETGPAHIQER